MPEPHLKHNIGGNGQSNGGSKMETYNSTAERLTKVEEKINALDVRLEDKFNMLSKRFEDNFMILSNKIDKLEGKFDKLEEKMDNMVRNNYLFLLTLIAGVIVTGAGIIITNILK
jgi:uncharacterized protein YlxW (UPF0749 family)